MNKKVLKTVQFLCPSNVMGSSIFLPLEMLHIANNLNRSQNKKGQQQSFTVEVISESNNSLELVGGLNLASKSLHLAEQEPDLLILPALWRSPLKQLNNHALLDYLSSFKHKKSTVCAVGTSSFLLAETGLLDGQAATTHWFYNQLFEQRYPNINLKKHYLITESNNIYCAGSVNSVADLMVYLIRGFYGNAIANSVERQFSPEIRQDFEKTAYRNTSFNPLHDELILEAQLLMQKNISKPIKITDIARHVDLSSRSFNRRFKAATDLTPTNYYHTLRLEHAASLLQQSNLSIAEIASLSGYEDNSHFAAQFKKMTSLTPLTYRQSVRAKLFSATSE